MLFVLVHYATIFTQIFFSHMKQLIADFTKHLNEGLTIGESFSVSTSHNIKNVLITGLGGSGIGGKIVSEKIASACKVPVVCNSDYTIPEFVNENTLVIANSYSGNTEETLEAFELAKKKGAILAGVSSGGLLIEKLKEINAPHIIIPGGHPPRAAFGYSFVQLFYILHGFGIIGNDFIGDFNTAIDYLDQTEEKIQQAAKDLASKVHEKHIVIYSSLQYLGVSTRFRQQLNENAKVLCNHHALPEMNHNELVGWAGGSDDIAVIQLIGEDDHPRTKERFRISQEIISQHTPHIFNIQSEGNTLLQRYLFFIHLGDWTSLFLSELRGVDPVEVNVIDHLKSSLAKI